MRALRTTMLIATLATLALGAQLAACGGDDDKHVSPGVPDASTPTTGPTLTVSSTRAKLYLGQSAKIDGAAIAPDIVSKFAWTVVAAPSTSAIKNESIQDAATASPSLKPDQLGLFTIQLSGEKADGVAASVLVILEAIDAPVFVRDMHLTGDPSGGNITIASSTLVAGAYGTTARTVGCPVTAVMDGGGGGTSLAMVSFVSGRSSAVNGDSWEGPPGTPSRVVFPEFQLNVAGESITSITSSLIVATSSSACGAPEAKVLETKLTDADAAANGGGEGPIPPNFIFNARFSPDGNRIAYINDVDRGARLSTIGFDGADKRDLTPVTAAGDGGLNPDAGSTVFSVSGSGYSLVGPTAPRWKDASHVGWVSFIGDDAATPDRSEWELWVIEDKPGATAELAMRCSGSGLTHFEFLPDGTVVASARHVVSTDEGETSRSDLLVYRPNAATKECEIARNLTNHTTEQQIARDFAVSPDKSTIAFFAGVGTGVPTGNPTDNITQLTTVPVDGSRAPAAVPGVTGPGDFGVGPRWAAGGTVITYGQVDISALGGGGSGLPVPAGRLMSVPVAGGKTVVVADNSVGASVSPDGGPSIDYHVSYGMGQGCSAAPGAVSNGIMLVVGALGFGTLVARRRRSSTR